jgi:hypothetical protein
MVKEKGLVSAVHILGLLILPEPFGLFITAPDIHLFFPTSGMKMLSAPPLGSS